MLYLGIPPRVAQVLDGRLEVGGLTEHQSTVSQNITISLKMRHGKFTVVYTSQYPYFKLVQFNTRKIIFTDKDSVKIFRRWTNLIKTLDTIWNMNATFHAIKWKHPQSAVCPRSLDPFYTELFYIKLVKTSWTHSSMLYADDHLTLGNIRQATVIPDRILSVA